MLVECTECGGEVSDRAISCPHCGIPIREPEDQVLSYMRNRSRFGLRISGVFTVLGLLFLLAAAAASSQVLLIPAALFGLSGIMGLMVHSMRLSHLREYDDKGGRERKG
jgi:hypothetical protein